MSLIHLLPPLARRAAAPRQPSHESCDASGDAGLVCLAGERAPAHEAAAREVAEATRRVLLRDAVAALQPGPCAGLAPLRAWVAERLARRGLDLDPRQVLITTGTRQALDLLGRVLLDRSSPLLVQRPTSVVALRAFASYAPRLVGVPVDEQGPQAQAFAAALPGARMAYLQSCFADPGGTSIAAERAGQLVAALREAPCWLVEDESCAELWLDEPAPPGLLARGAPHGVLVGRFPDPLFPGLGLGWVAGSAALVARLAQARDAAHGPPPAFHQRVALDMLRDGALERVSPALRGAWRERREAALGALRRHMPVGVRWLRPRGGMFVWLTLPDTVDVAGLVLAAREQGVCVLAGADFDVGTGGCASFGDCWDCRFCDHPESAAPARNTLRLSFAAAAPQAVAAGVERLARVLRGVCANASGCPRQWPDIVSRA